MGLWRRTLLQTPEQCDVDSRVYWLQTAVWHGDLRLPVGRPEFGRVHSLRQCSRVHLEWLLRQEGFAGVTKVDGHICEWHRRMDYHPRDWRDIGNMHFCAAGLEESGVEQQYRERWEPEPLDCRRFSAQHLQLDGLQRLLLRAGEYFMHLRPRSLGEVDARRLWARVEKQRASLDEMRQLADFEISFGRHQEGVLRIVHSTLPWLEGGVLPQMGDWTTLPGD
ncbi:hypothetical protein GALL_317740 [mine drainage metagenome]|uniref:Uncharacterized protein n=1 Tax=mine drainage metagenome TaxID=410659 RepID=A0A1J5R322_9ZZZZ